MSSEHIPAWKRIGLKVKESLEVDPLALTAHLDSAKVTKKQAKKLNKRKLEDDASDKRDKKEPKRAKLPKSERPPPPEKDQLVYLRSYTTDRDNWKFSKQKQNWILKHIKTIEDKYEGYLIDYLVGIQGGSRDQLVEKLRGVITNWNKAATEDEKKDDLAKDDKDDSAEAKSEKTDSSDTQESVDSDYATRAQKIIKAITGEDLELAGISSEAEESSPVEKSTEVTPDSKDESGEEELEGAEEKDKIEESTPPLNNLIIEEVEVMDFVTEEDTYDVNPEETVEKDAESESKVSLEAQEKDQESKNKTEKKKGKKKGKKSKENSEELDEVKDDKLKSDKKSKKSKKNKKKSKSEEES